MRINKKIQNFMKMQKEANTKVVSKEKKEIFIHEKKKKDVWFIHFLYEIKMQVK